MKAFDALKRVELSRVIFQCNKEDKKLVKCDLYS